MMIDDWKSISLGEILRLERRPVKLVPEQEYAEIGIRSFGRGIFHKNPRTGFEIGNKDLFLIKQGDFIFQITFAWEGAVGLASEAEDGMYGSVRFPTFQVNENICHPTFLLNYFKTDEGRSHLIKISPGSAGRNRVLATKRLPEILVPLPPLTEQLRIVRRIEALAGRVAEAQSLRREASEEVKVFMQAALREVFGKSANWKNYKLDDVAPINMGQSPSGDSYNADGEGFPLLNGPTEFGQHHPTPRQWTTSPTKFCKPGDILICVRGATTGKMNWADQKYCVGRGLAALTADTDKCVPEYVFYFVQTQTQEIYGSTIE